MEDDLAYFSHLNPSKRVLCGANLCIVRLERSAIGTRQELHALILA